MRKVIIIEVITLVILFCTYWYSENKPTSETDSYFRPSTTIETEYSAWIPWWNNEANIISLKNAKSVLKTISPVWYRLEENTDIQEIRTEDKKEIMSIAESADIKVIPSITNDFDPQRVKIILHDEAKMNESIIFLKETALTRKYAGWDIDWEELYLEDKKTFSHYVSSLAKNLHDSGLVLSVTVHPQTGTEIDSVSSKSQEWISLSKDADIIRIMAYDFHHSASSAGPITPNDWLTKVIDHAITKIPKNKIVLGLPLYGYDWVGKEGKSVSFLKAKSILDSNQIVDFRDKNSLELYAKYDIDSVNHELWYSDRASVYGKIGIAQNKGIYRFCFWSLGEEDENIWTTLPSSK